MPIIQEFTCCICNYFCTDYCAHGGNADAHQNLWDRIHSSNEHMATVNCPRCSKSTTQCTLCARNIDSINHPALKSLGRTRRTAEAYIKQHIKRCHPDEIGHENNITRMDIDTEPTHQSDQVHIDLGSFFAENYECLHDSLLNCSINSNMSVEFDSNSPIDAGTSLVGVFNEDQNMLFSNKDASLCSTSASEESQKPAYDNDGHLYADYDNEVHLYGEKEMTHVLESENDKLGHDIFIANKFLSPYMDVALDPNVGCESEQTTHLDENIMAAVLKDSVHGGYEYDDFDFFDTRLGDEKLLRRGGSAHKKSQNQLYFWQKYKQKCKNPADDTGGYAGLVHRANIKQREDGMGMACKTEASLMFKLQRILLKSTRTMREELMDYQSDLLAEFDIERSGGSTAIRIPTTMEETRAAITEGTHSTVKNFPIPRVFEVGNDKGHACVSLIEVIRLMAGHGAKFNFAYDGVTKERNRDGLNGSKAADDIIKNLDETMKAANVEKETRDKTKKGWILMWSDAFLRCFIKQKENSVWIITVTVCPPPNKMSSGLYTHVLAMGKSGSDHMEVINYYLEEMKLLRAGFKCYMGATNTIEHVALDMIVWNADRPERQMLQCTRKEGTYGKVSGYAVKPHEEKLPSCPTCYERLINEMMCDGEVQDCREELCHRCCNWSFEPATSNIYINDTVGKDYPRSTSEDSSDQESEPEGRESGKRKLGPVKLSSAWMSKVVRHAYRKVFKKRWSKANTQDYLRRCNVGGKKAEAVFSMAEDDRIENEFNPASVEHKAWSLVDCFGKFKFPDVPLHGIGHGMVPDVMYIVQQIFSHHNKYQAFVRYSNVILDDCASLRLEFLKLKSLPKAAWVGENCMSYMRLMSYLVGSFLSNNKLSQREDETRETEINLKCMLNAFQSLVSVLMTKRELDRKTINNHVKIFLSSAHYLHEKYGNLNRKTRQTEHINENRGGRKKKFVDTLTFTQLREMLQEFSVDTDGLGRAALLKKLNQVKKDALMAKLSEWHKPILGDKDTLYQRIAEYLNVTQREVQEEDDVNEDTTDGNNNNGQEEDGPTTKRENRCWNKGNWLSFLANISDQIEYLGPLQHIWEGRNERMIEGPKQVLVSMRKDQGYRLTKMRLLHKLVGLEWLALAYHRAGADRDWFKGYHIYNTQYEVLDRFQSGRPLSCFSKEEGSSRVHVAYTDGSGVSYITFKYETTSYYKEETGVQFCKFSTVHDEHRNLVVETVKQHSDLVGVIATYAIMLPYKNDKHKFMEQYTLIYHDWDVLVCNTNDGKLKGIPFLQKSLFSQEYIQQIRR